MDENDLKTISGDVNDVRKVDVDYALNIAGTGWYNIKYSINLGFFLIAAIVEPMGYSYVLPAAKCDLDMTDTQRGFVASIPYIGLVVTSFGWGYLVDTCGRKKMIVLSSFAAGIFSIASAFMPNLVTFCIMKSLVSLCIACPAAVPFTFIGEIMPQKHRDITLSVTNSLQIIGSALMPLLAWAILPLDINIDFGIYYFTPWRLLTILYALPFIISAGLLTFGPESPKYLLSKGKHDESLQVLRNIYAANRGKPPDDFPIKQLKAENPDAQKSTFLKSIFVQSAPLLKPPYLKWMILNSVLLFGVFATLNGLQVWLPDVLNRVLMGGGEGKTACAVIAQRLNETDVNAECDNSIDPMTFVINSIATGACAVISLLASSTVKLIGKKSLLILVYFTIGTFCVLINFVTQKMLFAVLLSSLPIMGLAIGPINAYAVQFFPTYLRGMAIGLTMMCGRSGSIIGANVTGILINAACEATFYGYGGLIIGCGLLSFLLPRSQHTKKIPKLDKVILTKL